MSTPTPYNPIVKETPMPVDSDCIGELLEADRVSNSARSIIREVSTDTQFLDNGQKLLGGELASGFLGSARGQAATDRNVDHGFMGVAHGQAATDRNVDHGLREVAEQVTGVDRDVLRGSWESERGQRVTDNRTSDGFYRTDRAVENNRYSTAQGFAHTNEEMSEAFGGLSDHLDVNARFINDTIRNSNDATQARMADAENRLTRLGFESEGRVTKNLTDSERRLGHQIDRDVTHALEEVSENLSDFDRRTAVMQERLQGEVKLEAERTRELGLKTELETRLYLRDRQDRTEDLLRGEHERGRELTRSLFQETAERLDDFERRNRTDEVVTRDLIRSLDAERSENAFIKNAIANSELRTQLAIQAALCGDKGGSKGINFEPNITINMEQEEEEFVPRRRRRSESSQTV